MLHASVTHRWFLPGLGGGCLVVGGDEEAPGGSARVPASFAASAVSAWLSSCPRTVEEIFEALGGERRSGLSIAEARHFRDQVERRVARAFLDGILVALRIELPVHMPVRKPRPPPEPVREPTVAKSRITIQLVGEDGCPLRGECYRLILPDHSVREGTLDSAGTATLSDIPSGVCKVMFPNLDSEAWEPIETTPHAAGGAR
jgi:hypothetical protein